MNEALTSQLQLTLKMSSDRKLRWLLHMLGNVSHIATKLLAQGGVRQGPANTRSVHASWKAAASYLSIN